MTASQAAICRTPVPLQYAECGLVVFYKIESAIIAKADTPNPSVVYSDSALNPMIANLAYYRCSPHKIGVVFCAEEHFAVTVYR
jgi:hypothetical protein